MSIKTRIPFSQALVLHFVQVNSPQRIERGENLMKRAKIIQVRQKTSTWTELVNAINYENMSRLIFVLQKAKARGVSSMSTTEFEKSLASNIFLK
jgi:hypothetical protein